ncbi:MAG: hypothetical protein ACI9JN_000970 [Bacteroidia bacterium]|jgi:hypothetical protein
MKFILDFPIPVQPLLNYQTPVITMGSCFADRMADKLVESRFNVFQNPSGIIYNPISIAKTFSNSNQEEPNPSDLIFDQGLWHSWHHHGQFSNANKEALVSKITETNKGLQSWLGQEKSTVLITFGSAWVYENNDQIVANCHKRPNKNFTKRLLQPQEIIEAFLDILKRYPQHDFLFTVSPVRYTRDGLHNSTLSKSVLHLAVNALVQQFKHCHYFPAYEIVMDELRDYRFYDTDLVHPNQLAIDYVWDKFKATALDEMSQAMIKDWQVVQKMKEHKLLYPDSLESVKFMENRTEKVRVFEATYFRQ